MYTILKRESKWKDDRSMSNLTILRDGYLSFVSCIVLVRNGNLVRCIERLAVSNDNVLASTEVTTLCLLNIVVLIVA